MQKSNDGFDQWMDCHGDCTSEDFACEPTVEVPDDINSPFYCVGCEDGFILIGDECEISSPTVLPTTPLFSCDQLENCQKFHTLNLSVL